MQNHRSGRQPERAVKRDYQHWERGRARTLPQILHQEVRTSITTSSARGLGQERGAPRRAICLVMRECSQRRRRAEPQRFHHREQPHGQQSSSQEFPLASGHLRRCRYGRRGTPAPLRVLSLVVKSRKAQPEALPSISRFVQPADPPPSSLAPSNTNHTGHTSLTWRAFGADSPPKEGPRTGPFDPTRLVRHYVAPPRKTGPSDQGYRSFGNVIAGAHTGPAGSRRERPCSIAGLTLMLAARRPRVRPVPVTVSPRSRRRSPPWAHSTQDESAPDPDVVRFGSTYFAYTTGTTWGNHIGVLRSSSPNSGFHTITGHPYGSSAFPSIPANQSVRPWQVNSTQNAPGVFFGGRYVMYYTAQTVSGHGGHYCLSRATSSSRPGRSPTTPAGPGCAWTTGGAIDPSPFVDRAGHAWLYFKTYDLVEHGPSPRRSTSFRLSADGLTPPARRRSRLSQTQLSSGNETVENPQMIYLGGTYMLLYSRGDWNASSYRQGYATCTGPAGPCRRRPGRVPHVVRQRARAGRRHDLHRYRRPALGSRTRGGTARPGARARRAPRARGSCSSPRCGSGTCNPRRRTATRRSRSAAIGSSPPTAASSRSATSSSAAAPAASR